MHRYNEYKKNEFYYGLIKKQYLHSGIQYNYGSLQFITTNMELMKTILFIPCAGTSDIIRRDKITNNDRLDLMTSTFNTHIDINVIH